MDVPNLEAQSSSWHPKITVYRLSVLATTIGLGTAKAISTQSGNLYIPVTLEWVAGVALFLVFHCMSVYDSDEAPRYLDWLFKDDCMDLVWSWFSFAFGMPRPRYATDEDQPEKGRNVMGIPNAPIFTLYRLLVSGTVIGFGMMKAMLGYYGLSTAANWVDWMVGVIATSVLYYIGLYEYNSAGRWRILFSTDRNVLVVGVRDLVLVFFAAIVGSAWMMGCGWAIRIYWKDPIIKVDASNPTAPSSNMSPEFISELSLRILATFMAVGYMGLGGAGVVMLVNATAGSRHAMMRDLRDSIAFNIVEIITAPVGTIISPIRPYLRAIRRYVLLKIQALLSSDLLSRTASARKLILRLTFHVLGLLGATVFMCVMSFSVFGLGYGIYSNKGGIVIRITLTGVAALFTFLSVLGFGVALRTLYQMLLPFYYLLRGQRRKFLDSIIAP